MDESKAPILTIIPPPVQYALAFAAGMAVDWFLPWRPAGRI
jgi:hypothetical protein